MRSTPVVKLAAERLTAGGFGRAPRPSINLSKTGAGRTAHPLLCNVNFFPYSKVPVAYVLFGQENNKQNRRFGRRAEGLGVNAQSPKFKLLREILSFFR